MSFNEQILDAAKSIASATSALVKSATAAQRELVAQGKLSSNPKSENGQWSEEMVSAVSIVASIHHSLPPLIPHSLYLLFSFVEEGERWRECLFSLPLFLIPSLPRSPPPSLMQAKLVASATSNLCEAANSVVTGEAQEEKLIAAAKAVASSTAYLLIACQVKANINSENNRRLQVKLTYILALNN